MAFLYDLAISLISRDLPIAEEIKARLKEKYNIFLYSDEQKNIVFHDADNVFNRVFKHESRAVLILYREEWGTTRWTGIEQAAIKERKLEHNSSLDFLGMLTLDGASPPEWYNKTYIFQQYIPAQLDSIIALIEQLIQRRGGVAKIKSPHERLMDRKIAKKERQQHDQKLLREGPENFRHESWDVMQKLNDLATSLNQIGELQFSIQFNTKTYDPDIRIYVQPIALYLYTGHLLTDFNHYDSYLALLHLQYREDRSEHVATRRNFRVDCAGEDWFWVESETATRYSFEEMPEYLMNELIRWHDTATKSQSGLHEYR